MDSNRKPLVLSQGRHKQIEMKYYRIISRFGCTTGTRHFLDTDTSLLKVVGHQGIPAFLLPKLSEIPIGKGMAGIAAEGRELVEMCNLPTDSSRVARPFAKETKVEEPIVVPMLLRQHIRYPWYSQTRSL